VFDKLIRELERLEGTTELTVKVEIDDKGYFDRQCPSEACGRAFKVHLEDWKGKVPDELDTRDAAGDSEDHTAAGVQVVLHATLDKVFDGKE